MSVTVYPLKVTKSWFKNYCYLIVHSETRHAILIDPAWEIDKIQQKIEVCQAQPVAILLTHHHIDHINLAEFFALHHNIPVWMSKVEMDYYGFSCRHLQPIEDPNDLLFNTIKVRPIFTPGHTKGALCYWIEDNLFTGDTLFIEGCGMCVGKGSNPSELFDSLSHLKKILPHETRIYPGHSYGQEPGQPFSWLLQNNIYLAFSDRENFIVFRMRKGQKGLFNFS